MSYHPGRLILLATTASLLLLPAGAPGADPSVDRGAFRERLLDRINQLRARYGRPPLEADSRLEAASQEWADHLATIRRLQHRSDDSLSSLSDSGGWETINENLYYSTSPPDPERILADWEKSPLHKKNLLNPAIRFAGLGTATAEDRTHYVVFNGAGGKRPKAWKDFWKHLPFSRRTE
ncbi:CAP domain-containing protein [Methylacidimicrobium sp. AP8]|uniref:CAP domain-containing protein n=1 Tax=Methylacidimicrobium sp. AP8 TaxID=2730359 RepID=UPI001920BF74|nr:CAP domain-containing protein [Methylacidimicrobium sp. AP8]